MDISNYPLHLTPAELEYELNIRGMFNYATNRLKSLALRERLAKESAGTSIPPKRSDFYAPDEEFRTCEEIIKNILSDAEVSIKSGSTNYTARCSSRLFHVQARLERIVSNDEELQRGIDNLAEGVYETLVQLAEVNKSTSDIETLQNLRTQKDNWTDKLSIGSRQILDSDERRSSVDEIQRSIGRFSERISALNFSDTSALEGAVGGDQSSPGLEALSVTNPFRVEKSDKCVGGNESFGTNPFLDAQFDDANVQVDKTFNRNRNLLGERLFSNDQKLKVVDIDGRKLMFSRPMGDDNFLGNFERSNHRKTVPVNQWRFGFSGDGSGLHLYDFLSQVELYQRSEGIEDEEMVYSIIHLLSGRARLWYMSVCDQYHTWNQVVRAMKKEFLPANYDFHLINDINNRSQKKEESFAEFITHMKALFRCLAIPIDEDYKLFVVQKNLLPKYALAIAPLHLNSLEELCEACRRIDNATAMTNRMVFSMPFERPLRSDVYAMQQATQPSNSSYESSQNFGYRGQTHKCWNCASTGHSHRECPRPRSGVFCYKCGARNVVTSRCQRCSGNELAGRTTGGSAPNPAMNN